MSALPDAPQAVIFREATHHDWLQISEWIAQTWDWGDYIDESVWANWAAPTPNTHLILADLGGEIVGFSRLIKLGEAEWWLEGVRVAPAHRGHGIGKVMLSYMISLFKRVGDGILRFFTGSKNDAMHAVARDLGFIHRMSYTQMEAPVEARDFRNFKVLQHVNAEMVTQYLQRSPMFRANHFIERDWTAYYLTRVRVVDLLSDPQVQVLGWRQLDQLYGVVILVPYEPESEEGKPMYIGYIDAPDDTTLRAMLEALQGLAHQRGYDRIFWRMPLGVGLERPVQRTSYTRQWEGALWLFELPIRSANPMNE